MQTAPAVFNFENTNVRVIERDGDPWFVAKDVAEAMDYKWNGTARIAHVPEEWRGVTSVATPSGDQEMAVLAEPGLYFFLNRSDKPKALSLQKWLAGDVLPSIRKTGGYRHVTGPAESKLPATLTSEQYEAERARLDALQARLAATPITLTPEEYERLTEQRLLVGKKTYLVTELIGILEHYGIPREVAEEITGHNRNNIRQHALLARRRNQH